MVEFHIMACCLRRKKATIMSDSQEKEGYLWSFGFGSNMDKEALKKRKQVDVIEDTPAILRDWKFSYIPGIGAEPVFANVEVKSCKSLEEK